MNTNWNPHSLQSMMYTNHYAMTMNPYFMANPHAIAMANQMQMMPNAGMMQQNGNLQYNGDGFEQSYLQGAQGSEENAQPDMTSEGEGAPMMVI
jgi:hypothetical protein